jgi:hypothetical protein
MNCLAILLSLTTHLNVEGDYNNVHPQIECEYTHSNTIVGTYYNSENNVSLYAGTRIPLRKNWEIDLVIATGYRIRDVQPMIRFKKNNVYIAPMYEKYNNTNSNYGVVIGYEMKLK